VHPGCVLLHFIFRDLQLTQDKSVVVGVAGADDWGVGGAGGAVAGKDSENPDKDIGVDIMKPRILFEFNVRSSGDIWGP